MFVHRFAILSSLFSRFQYTKFADKISVFYKSFQRADAAYRENNEKTHWPAQE